MPSRNQHAKVVNRLRCSGKLCVPLEKAQVILSPNRRPIAFYTPIPGRRPMADHPYRRTRLELQLHCFGGEKVVLSTSLKSIPCLSALLIVILISSDLAYLNDGGQRIDRARARRTRAARKPCTIEEEGERR